MWMGATFTAMQWFSKISQLTDLGKMESAMRLSTKNKMAICAHPLEKVKIPKSKAANATSNRTT